MGDINCRIITWLKILSRGGKHLQPSSIWAPHRNVIFWGERTSSNHKLHFEVFTHELLNDKASLTPLSISTLKFQPTFCFFNKKITFVFKNTFGNNYIGMLHFYTGSHPHHIGLRPQTLGAALTGVELMDLRMFWAICLRTK
jgi:hypothetical protein